MKVRKFISLLFITLVVSTNAQDKPPIKVRLDELVKENEIPGLNFSIIYSDGTQENYTSGFANSDEKIMLNSDHVLFTGSIGKTFAVTLLMRLVDEGKINLSDKFIDHFEDVDWIKNLPNINDITVLMLLQHSSGLPRYVHHKEVWKTTRNEPDKVWSYKDRLEYIFEDDPVNEAGKDWNYSDTGYLLIGMLVDKYVNGYYETVKKDILKPNNLNNTYEAITRDLPNLAVGYSDLPDFVTPKVTVVDGRYYFNPQMEWTGGGFASTTPDLARWAKLYFDGNLFSDSLHQLMLKPSFELEPNLDYGAGCFIYKTKVGKAYGHTGLMPGYKSVFMYFPKEGITCALQMNCDYGAKNLSLVGYVERILM